MEFAMTSFVEDVKTELNKLIKEGDSLYKLLVSEDCDDAIFIPGYQIWYTKALNVVRVFLPERLEEFRLLHQDPKRRKGIDYLTYTMSDYLIGLVVKYAGRPAFDTRQSAGRKFLQQLMIVISIRDKLGTILGNLRGMLQADLFDSELETARVLWKNGHLRAAGALTGVVLEKHLKTVCENHSITTRKKAPGISDYNQLLKSNNVVDIPNWRLIQRLGDLRNLCSHAKDREPTSDEVQELIDSTDKILKTLY
jgi:hypothetical protein